MPQAPVSIRPTLAFTIVALALSYAIQLPSSVFGSVFIGLRRNELYAAGLIATRGLTFVAVLALVFMTRSLIAMSLAWLVASIIGAVVKVALWRRYSPHPRFALSDCNITTLWEMAGTGWRSPFGTWLC